MVDYNYNHKKDIPNQFNRNLNSNSTSNDLNNTHAKSRHSTNSNIYNNQSGIQNHDDGYNRLSSKVSLLKQISLDMGDEIQEGNKELGSIHEDLSETGQKLKRTMEKFTKMAKEQFKNGGIYLWLLIFFLFMLMLIFFFIKSK